MQLLSPSVSRVQRNTAESVNRRIADKTLKRVLRVAAGGSEAINRRLRQLDWEWDIERVIETAAPVGILLGLTLGLTKNKRFLAAPAAIATALIVHGVQGWVPPLPVLRRLGLRTPEEIDEERYALRALRGDFDGLPHDPAQIFSIMRHSPTYESPDDASDDDGNTFPIEPTPGSAEGDRDTIEADLASREILAEFDEVSGLGTPNAGAGAFSKEAFDAQTLENRIQGG